MGTRPVKELHEMTEEELIAEVKTWDMDAFWRYAEEFYPEVIEKLKNDA